MPKYLETGSGWYAVRDFQYANHPVDTAYPANPGCFSLITPPCCMHPWHGGAQAQAPLPQLLGSEGCCSAYRVGNQGVRGAGVQLRPAC